MTSLEQRPEQQRYVGQSMKSAGDRRLVTGSGQYVGDVHLPGLLTVAMVRSPYAHAEIEGIDDQAALATEGVLAVVSGEQLKEIMYPLVTSSDLPPGRQLERYPLATGRARFAGDAICAVIAESPAAARDAADLVQVSYKQIDAVADAEEALKDDAPRIYPDWDSNLAYLWEVNSGDLDAARKSADREVSVRLRNQRIHAAFIEPRTVTATYDQFSESLTVWASSQVPHTLRGAIAGSTGVPEPNVRVIAPDVGGAFGAKGGVYADYVLIAALAHHFQRPIHWEETRSESFQATNHGRDQIQKLTASVDSSGKILGLDVEIIANLGAYNAAPVPTRSGIMSTGAYKIQNLRSRVLGVMTNTTQIGAYRGAGRPEAAYMLERLVDQIARELDLDPAAVRRANFIPADEFPYRGATGALYDSGDYDKALSKALEIVDYDNFRQDQAKARANGTYLGLGMAVYCEFAGPAWDSAWVRVHPSGTVTVATGTSPHGQGQEASLAQIAADELGVPYEDIVVKASDTAITPQGIGTFGSRGTSIGGSAILLASQKVSAKAREIAAAALEVSAEDIEMHNHAFQVRGAPDRVVTFKDVARMAHSMTGAPGGLEPGLEATSYFLPDGRTFPFGAHIAIVEVDPEIGDIDVKRYVAVDDCGPLINPQRVEGQVVGGLAQGFGQALQEQIVYDSNGQLLSGSFMDYAAPRANQVPVFETAHTVTPSPTNPLGVKGVGEAGTTGAPPALVNAVIDALSPLGVTHIDMPMTAERVWQAVRDAKR